jgi:hypothetical protein
MCVLDEHCDCPVVQEDVRTDDREAPPDFYEDWAEYETEYD